MWSINHCFKSHRTRYGFVITKQMRHYPAISRVRAMQATKSWRCSVSHVPGHMSLNRVSKVPNKRVHPTESSRAVVSLNRVGKSAIMLTHCWINKHTFKWTFLSSSFQTLLADNHPIIAAHRPARWSLITLARRQNAKLKANASLARDSRAATNDSVLYRRRYSAQQPPDARDGARPALQPPVSAFPEARWKQVYKRSQILSTLNHLTCLFNISFVCWWLRTDNVELILLMTQHGSVRINRRAHGAIYIFQQIRLYRTGLAY